jgi:hypothetical protein
MRIASLGSDPTTDSVLVPTVWEESPVADPHPIPQEETDIQLARQVDAICRRFEADWRASRRPVIGDYLGEVSDEGRLALRAELEALDGELRQASGKGAGSTGTPPSTVAVAATIAPVSPPTSPIPGMASPAVHEQGTLPPRDQATVDLGSPETMETSASELTRVRYFW